MHREFKPTKQISKYKVLRYLHKVQITHYVNHASQKYALGSTATDIGLCALCYVR